MFLGVEPEQGVGVAGTWGQMGTPGEQRMYFTGWGWGKHTLL